MTVALNLWDSFPQNPQAQSNKERNNNNNKKSRKVYPTVLLISGPQNFQVLHSKETLKGTHSQEEPKKPG